METLLIRADASAEIGTGHIMRCLALAQAWRRKGGEAVFSANSLPPKIKLRIAEEGFETRNATSARQISELAIALNARWVVVDGYDFGADFQRELKSAGLRVVFVDDNCHSSDYVADIVLNQNVYATESMYKHRSPDTRLLLGTSYCLLRNEFLRWQSWKREIPRIGRRILLTFGGSDPENETLRAIEALPDLVEAAVVVGAAFPDRESIEKSAEREKPSIRVFSDVRDMSDLMSWADLAVSGSGSTSWELAFMGLPSILIVLADNQTDVAAEMERRRAAVVATMDTLPDALQTLIPDQDTRQSLSSRGRQLVDGRGTDRVVAAMMGGSD